MKNNFPDYVQSVVKRCPRAKQTGHPAWVGELDECPRCAGLGHGPPGSNGARSRGEKTWTRPLGGVDPEMILGDPVFEAELCQEIVAEVAPSTATRKKRSE